MVAMMRALMMEPQAILLDEPTLGLSPVARETVLDLVRGARVSGVAVVLVEQNARKALEVSDRCYVMRSGRVVYEALSRDALRDYEKLADEYFGAYTSLQVSQQIDVGDARG
jgi:ABC-type branched-subunit amino acid transport system ATPase component